MVLSYYPPILQILIQTGGMQVGIRQVDFFVEKVVNIFDGSQKYLGVFDEEKNEEKMPIERLEDIYGVSPKNRKSTHTEP